MSDSSRKLETREQLIPFSKRLQQAIDRLGVEKKAFAQAGGIKQPTLTAYLNAQSQPSQDVVANWILVYSINANWLLTGEGSMFRGEEGGQALTIKNLATHGDEDQAYVVHGDEPLPTDGLCVPVHGQTGAGNAVERWEPEPLFWVVIPTRFGRPGMQVIQVDGDSMEPDIRDKAWVGVDTQDRTPKSGRVMAVAVPYEGLLIKRVFVDHEHNKLVLKSSNPAYPEARLPLEDLDRLIVGRVVWLMQDM